LAAGLLPQELDAVLDNARAFLAREMPLERRLAWDHDDYSPQAELRRLLDDEVGLHLMFLPQAHGGLGASVYDLYRYCRELGSIDLGVATSLLSIALGCEPIRVGGTAEQRDLWLGRVALQGLVVGYAVTETSGGSDVAGIQTTATPLRDASGAINGYRLNGVKQFISNGGFADLFTVLARAPEGPSFFVCERARGVTSGPAERKHGIRLSNTTQVVFDGVDVPAQNLLGLIPGKGLRQAGQVFGFTRLMVGSLGLGAGLAALERAVEYSRQRRSGGQLLCERSGYCNKLLVPHRVRLSAAQAYIEQCADLLETQDDCALEGAVAKLFASEAANAAADDAVQALGGYGYCHAYEVEKIRRDARILKIYEGTSEIQQNIIGSLQVRALLRSNGGLYLDRSEQLARLRDVGGEGLGRVGRFLASALPLAFRERVLTQQHALMEVALAIADFETACALSQRAAKVDDPFLRAQARLRSRDVVLEIPLRVLRLCSDGEVLPAALAAPLVELANLPRALAEQSGASRDMTYVAEQLTRGDA
jgi:alkylation response protein AidB-like acyl-CoA dehydrogenase